MLLLVDVCGDVVRGVEEREGGPGGVSAAGRGGLDSARVSAVGSHCRSSYL